MWVWILAGVCAAFEASPYSEPLSYLPNATIPAPYVVSIKTTPVIFPPGMQNITLDFTVLNLDLSPVSVSSFLIVAFETGTIIVSSDQIDFPQNRTLDENEEFTWEYTWNGANLKFAPGPYTIMIYIYNETDERIGWGETTFYITGDKESTKESTKEPALAQLGSPRQCPLTYDLVISSYSLSPTSIPYGYPTFNVTFTVLNNGTDTLLLSYVDMIILRTYTDYQESGMVSIYPYIEFKPGESATRSFQWMAIMTWPKGVYPLDLGLADLNYTTIGCVISSVNVTGEQSLATKLAVAMSIYSLLF